MLTIQEALCNALAFNERRRARRQAKRRAHQAFKRRTANIEHRVESNVVAIREPLGEILTPEELAERLKVPVRWVYEKQRSRCKNPIPSIPMGRYIRFDWNRVVRWLVDQSNLPASVVTVPRRKKAV
jgi:hypothetical protein